MPGFGKKPCLALQSTSPYCSSRTGHLTIVEDLTQATAFLSLFLYEFLSFIYSLTFSLAYNSYIGDFIVTFPYMLTMYLD
jgi:hypothetical protein